ncbi:MAG: hypothetical protein ACRDF8_10315, partial [Chloroflexota bacterium]
LMSNLSIDPSIRHAVPVGSETASSQSLGAAVQRQQLASDRVHVARHEGYCQACSNEWDELKRPRPQDDAPGGVGPSGAFDWCPGCSSVAPHGVPKCPFPRLPEHLEYRRHQGALGPAQARLEVHLSSKPKLLERKAHAAEGARMQAEVLAHQAFIEAHEEAYGHVYGLRPALAAPHAAAAQNG